MCKISEFADRPLQPVIQAVNPCRKILSFMTQKRREEDGAGQRVLSHRQGRRCCHGPSLAPPPHASSGPLIPTYGQEMNLHLF